jgi:uncharacterized hydrophobic protein (TIGR00341 family)
MTFRLIEVILPREQRTKVIEILREADVAEHWSTDLGEDLLMVSFLIPTEGTEPIMDKFEEAFTGLEGYKTLIIEVLAFTPRPKKAEEEEQKGEEESEGRIKTKGRVSREELYQTLTDNAETSRSYIALMFLSVVVAAIGIFEDNVAIVLGAAVINPLLGPNMALSLATNLADRNLALVSMRSVAAGIAIILFVAILAGLIIDLDPFIESIVLRREAGLGEIVLAVASGSAAALLLTIKASTSLVGVGAAVALLPPLVTFGLLVGEGELELSIGSLLLFITDLISINLAGVFTFYIMGIRPNRWWEEERARRSTAIAISVWALLLIVLVVVFVFLSPLQ